MKKLEVGATVAYPKSGNTTSKLKVTAVSDALDPIYCLSSKDGKFNVNIYHSQLEDKLGLTPKEDDIQGLHRATLKNEAMVLGIDFPNNIPTGKLNSLIEAHQNGAK